MADTANYAGAFVDRHRPVDKTLQGIADVAILKGRSVANPDFERFVNSIPRTAGQSLTVQMWYPPMWDEFTYRGSRLTCNSISAGQEQTQVSDETASIRIKALSPGFMAPGLGHGPRYANNPSRISMYGRSEFGAEVLPPYEKSVARLFGIGLMTDWRAGPGGPTFLGRYAGLNDPSQSTVITRDVIAAVLAGRGWQSLDFSPAGNVAYQMMGIWVARRNQNPSKPLRSSSFLKLWRRDATWQRRKRSTSELTQS